MAVITARSGGVATTMLIHYQLMDARRGYSDFYAAHSSRVYSDSGEWWIPVSTSPAYDVAARSGIRWVMVVRMPEDRPVSVLFSSDVAYGAPVIAGDVLKADEHPGNQMIQGLISAVKPSIPDRLLRPFDGVDAPPYRLCLADSPAALPALLTSKQLTRKQAAEVLKNHLPISTRLIGVA